MIINRNSENQRRRDIVFWVLNQSGVKLKLKLSTCFGGQATQSQLAFNDQFFFGLLSKRQNEKYFTTQTPKNTSKRDSTVGPKALELVVSYGIQEAKDSTIYLNDKPALVVPKMPNLLLNFSKIQYFRWIIIMFFLLLIFDQMG